MRIECWKVYCYNLCDNDYKLHFTHKAAAIETVRNFAEQYKGFANYEYDYGKGDLKFLDSGYNQFCTHIYVWPGYIEIEEEALTPKDLGMEMFDKEN